MAHHCACLFHFSLFLQFGDVKDIIILKDKVTGQPRGCAFVSYATKEEAEAAIGALNKGVHLPGALCPMEVGRCAAHAALQSIALHRTKHAKHAISPRTSDSEQHPPALCNDGCNPLGAVQCSEVIEC